MKTKLIFHQQPLIETNMFLKINNYKTTHYKATKSFGQRHMFNTQTTTVKREAQVSFLQIFELQMPYLFAGQTREIICC